MKLDEFKTVINEEIFLSSSSDMQRYINLKIYPGDMTNFKSIIYEMAYKKEIPLKWFETPERFLTADRGNLYHSFIIIELDNCDSKKLSYIHSELKSIDNLQIVIFITNFFNAEPISFCGKELLFPLADTYEIADIGRKMGLDKLDIKSFYPIAKAFVGLDRTSIFELLNEIYFIRKIRDNETAIRKIHKFKKEFFSKHFEFFNYSFPESEKRVFGYEFLFDWIKSNFQDKTRSNILISGKDGTGKTSFAYQAAFQLGIPLLEIKPKLLLKSDKPEAKLKAILRTIETLPPCVLLIEGYDKYFSESVINEPGEPLFNPLFFDTWLNFLQGTSNIVLIGTSEEYEPTIQEKRLFKTFSSDSISRSTVLALLWNILVKYKIPADFKRLEFLAAEITKTGLTGEFIKSILEQVLNNKNNKSITFDGIESILLGYANAFVKSS